MSTDNSIPSAVLAAWPNCQTPDCEYKARASANSVYCAQCTDRLQAHNSAPPGYFDEFRAAQLAAHLGTI